MDKTSLSDLISSAVKMTKNDLPEDHRARSRAFLKSLHEGIQAFFKSESDVKVFSSNFRDNDFNRSEYLYDILVARFKRVKSPFQENEIAFLSENLIELESEFSTNTRDTLIDFSKLNVGSAKEKVFILPFFNRNDDLDQWFENIVFKNISNQNRKFFFVYLDHPMCWGEKEVQIKIIEKEK